MFIDIIKYLHFSNVDAYDLSAKIFCHRCWFVLVSVALNDFGMLFVSVRWGSKTVSKPIDVINSQNL